MAINKVMKASNTKKITPQIFYRPPIIVAEYTVATRNAADMICLLTSTDHLWRSIRHSKQIS